MVWLQIFAALPAGFLADHYRRDRVLRIAAAIGFTAALIMATGLYLERALWHFVLAMALLGTYKGFNNPAIESIFADSVQTGKRHANFPFNLLVMHVHACMCMLMLVFMRMIILDDSC
jgi:MFS family permease